MYYTYIRRSCNLIPVNLNLGPKLPTEGNPKEKKLVCTILTEDGKFLFNIMLQEVYITCVYVICTYF